MRSDIEFEGVLLHGVDHRHTYVTTATHLYVSCDMPGASKSEEEYSQALDSIMETIRTHQGHGRFRKRLVVGGYLNATMAPDLGDITGSACPIRLLRGVGPQAQDVRRSGWYGMAVTYNL